MKRLHVNVRLLFFVESSDYWIYDSRQASGDYMRKLFIFCLFVLSLFTLSASSGQDYIRPAVKMEEKENSAGAATRYVRPATPMEGKDEKAVEAPLYVRPAAPMKAEETEKDTVQYIRPASVRTEENSASEAKDSTPDYVRPASVEKNETSDGRKDSSSYQSLPDEKTAPQDSIYEESAGPQETVAAGDDYRPYSFSIEDCTFSGYTDYGYLSIYLDSYIIENLDAFILFEKRYGGGDILRATLTLNDYELVLSFDPSINGKYLIPLLEIEIGKYMNPHEENAEITEEVIAAEVLPAPTEETFKETRAEEPAVEEVIPEIRKETAAAVAEPGAETPAEYEETHQAEDGLFFCRKFSYRGVKAEVEVYSTHASLTLPAGTTPGDIDAAVGILRSIYPEEAADVTYSVEEDTVTICYPEQSKSFLLAAYDVLESIARDAVDIISSNAAADRVVAKGPAPEKEIVAVSTPVSQPSETTSSSSQTTTSSSPSPVSPVAEPAQSTAEEKDWTLSFSARGGILGIFQNNTAKGVGLSAGLDVDYAYSDFSLYGSLDMVIGSPFFVTADIGIRASRAVLAGSPFRVGVSAGVSFVPVLDNKVSLYAGIFTSLRIYNVDVFCELRRGLGGYTYFGLFGSYRFK